MKKIYLLTDYKGFFGSKHSAVPYRSGMDRELLRKYFEDKGYTAKFLPFCDVDPANTSFKGQYVLYTSSEDKDYHYKTYIEDICYALQLQGAIVIPEYKYLRANNNKVFMELLRDLCDLQIIKNLKARHFGTIEELKERAKAIEGKQVVKAAEGAMSKYVFLADDQDELLSRAKKISRTRSLFSEIWDFGRSLKRRGYIRESKHRKKFLVQPFVPNLPADWKILIYGKKYYLLHRQTRKNDFRASGSGRFSYSENLPDGMLDFAEKVFDSLNVPNLSLDVVFDGKEFYLMEFQAVYFGTTTIDKAPIYFIKENARWICCTEKSVLEQEYVNSIDLFLKEETK